MPLATEYIEAIYKAARTAIKKQSEVQSESSDVEKLAPFVTEMMLTAADVVVDTAKTGGKLSPVQVGTFIVNRVAGFAGLAESDKIQCFGAMLGLATSTIDFVGVVGLTASAEVGSGGVATPVVATISIPMLLSTSAALALSGASVHQQCGPVVSKFFKTTQDELLPVYMQFNTFIGNPSTQ